MKNYSTPFLEKLIPIIGIFFAVIVLTIVKPEILFVVTVLGIDVSQLVGLVVACYLLVVLGTQAGNVLYASIAFLLTLVGLIKEPLTCCQRVRGELGTLGYQVYTRAYSIFCIVGDTYLIQCPTCKTVWREMLA